MRLIEVYELPNYRPTYCVCRGAAIERDNRPLKPVACLDQCGSDIYTLHCVRVEVVILGEFDIRNSTPTSSTHLVSLPSKRGCLDSFLAAVST